MTKVYLAPLSVPSIIKCIKTRKSDDKVYNDSGCENKTLSATYITLFSFKYPE